MLGRNHFLVILFTTAATISVQTSVCGRQLHGPNGTFSTPNFPQKYPTNVNCVWRINVPRGAILRIRFEQFYTEGCCDFLDIRNRTFTLGKFSDNRGSFSVSPITAAEDNTIIEVEFNSDGTITKTGFIAYYTISPPPTTPIPSTPVTTVPPTTGPPFFGCGGMLNGSSGSFGTPGFPEVYDNNLNCTWTLRIAADGYLKLNFRLFNTEPCCDFVELTDSVGQRIQKHSGHKPAFVVRLFSNTTLIVKIRFTSDSSVRRRGFLANYIIASPPRTRSTPAPSVPATTLVTGLPTLTSIPFTTTAFPITPSASSLTPVTPSLNATLPPEVQRLFSNVLQSLKKITDEIEDLLVGSGSLDDIENFKNLTLQILHQVQNQLLATSPTRSDGLAKRAIPEFPNPLELRKLIEKLQRRLN